MTTSAVQLYKGSPTLFLNGQPTPPVVAFVQPGHIQRFKQAGIKLFTIWFNMKWWLGPDQYDFAEFDRLVEEYCKAIPEGYLMPRIDFAQHGFPWWGETNPDEMVVLRSVVTGGILDPSQSDPRGEEHLHHEIHLQGRNLHSFHSLEWREDAGQAFAAMIRHAEEQPYSERIWAWMPCDGWPQEWFHWGEYLLDGLEDYSPVARIDFRRWLRETYQDDEKKLGAAWGRQVTFDEACIPEPCERAAPSLGEFYDPVRDRPTIDYTQCMSDSMVDSIIALATAAKRAMRTPKVICSFYGYPFCHLPRPQLIGHNSLAKLLESPVVDLIASPNSYDGRGYGGYHSPQSMADSIRRAGKIHFDEVDSKTIWTPKVRWKDNISEPPDLWSTLEMLKKDAAYPLVSASGLWWCDLLNQGWFDADECVPVIRRLREIEKKLMRMERKSFGEIALVVNEHSQLFQAQKDGLIDASREMFRNWFLSRVGAPFEQLLLSDLARPGIPTYKLYIMADSYYLSTEDRDLVRRVAERNGATVLWVYAPGYLNDQSASLEHMQEITGIRFGKAEVLDELNVRVTNVDHPLTADLDEGLRYGTGVNRELYTQAPKIQFLPDTRVCPAFYVDDPDATILGLAESTGKPGLVVKEMGGWRSVYSAGPVLSWPLMRNIARWAGVHLYSEAGDMIWANDRLLVVYAQEAGRRTICFAAPVDVEDAYEGTQLARHVRNIQLNMQRYETRLLLLTHSQ